MYVPAVAPLAHWPEGGACCFILFNDWSDMMPINTSLPQTHHKTGQNGESGSQPITLETDPYDKYITAIFFADSRVGCCGRAGSKCKKKSSSGE